MKSNIVRNYNEALNRYELKINGLLFLSGEENLFEVPLNVIKQIKSSEFPEGLTLIPVLDKENGWGYNSLITLTIKNLDGKNACIGFNDCPNIEEVAHKIITYPLFQETLVDLLLLNKQLNPTILMNGFDGNSFHLHCSIELPDNIIGSLVQSAFDFYYLPAEQLDKAERKIIKLLREEVGLPEEPSELAKLGKIIFNDSE